MGTAVRNEEAPSTRRLGTHGRIVPARFSGVRVAAWASHIRARLLFIVLDALVVVAGYGVAEVTYFRDKPPALYWRGFLVFIVMALLFHLTANRMLGLYGRMWRHAGIEEARQVLLACLVVFLLLVPLRPLWHMVRLPWHDVSPHQDVRLEEVPLNVILFGLAFVTMALGALRFHSRLFAWQRGARRMGLRVAVIGSRDAGAAAVREMLRSPGAGLVPVAVFDDDGHSHGLSLLGVPVVGKIEDIPTAVSRYAIQQVLLAIPNASPSVVERALQASEKAGVPMRMIPSVRDVVDGKQHAVTIRQAREPRIEDLLGRNTVSTDLGAVRAALSNQRVLITGAGGSIGSEIARQVASLDPAQILLLDHDETHLYDIAMSLPGSPEQLLVDVSDRGAVFEAFLHYQPDVIFHAAAHKHVPVLEAYPIEAARINVLGTLNVVQAAAAVRTKRFVFISSDKAVLPVSVMGASKRMAERIVLAHRPEGAIYSAVRFGNVLGSRGSVIPTFARQIAAGGPITVTDARMTRFFMSVEEAVQLVLQASVLASGSDIFMLEMGEPVRILDLAQRMVRLSAGDANAEVPIQIVGRRPGEKIEEELQSPEEEVVATSHPSIRRLIPSSPRWSDVDHELAGLHDAVSRRDATAVKNILFLLDTPAAADASGDQCGVAGTNPDPVPA
jgi:FlaA1/EpsC-like NDP-sugar epimerase